MNPYIYSGIIISLCVFYAIYLSHICLRFYLIDADHVFSIKELFKHNNLFFIFIYYAFVFLNFLMGYPYIVSVMVGITPIIYLFLSAKKINTKRNRRHE